MNARVLLAAAGFATVAAFGSPGSAAVPIDTQAYVAGGTAVVKQGGEPVLVDEGAVVCAGSTAGVGVGVGGGCVSFGVAEGSTSVLVSDRLQRTAVPFQVCIDNDGDGLCTSPDSGSCADQVFFSHDDNGTNHNPLGPLPIGFATGCPGGAWNGYVVFLCNGVHDANGAHVHPATVGSIQVHSVPGTGYGTFCGGASENVPSNKPYVVVS